MVDGEWKLSRRIELGGDIRASGTEVIDTNGDGLQDILVADTRRERTMVYECRVDGAYVPHDLGPGARWPMATVGADIDLDGKADALISSLDQPQLVAWISSRGSYVHGALKSGWIAYDIAVGDIDRDGCQDIIRTLGASREATGIGVISAESFLDGNDDTKIDGVIEDPWSVACADTRGMGTLAVVVSSFSLPRLAVICFP